MKTLALILVLIGCMGCDELFIPDDAVRKYTKENPEVTCEPDVIVCSGQEYRDGRYHSLENCHKEWRCSDGHTVEAYPSNNDLAWWLRIGNK